MAFKEATLKIGICNYHGWPWDISLINKLHWHLFHRTFYYSVEISNYQPLFDTML
jgi:hypothetical protein